MADQCTSLTFACFYQQEGMEELKQTLMFTTVELETTLMSAKEEITRRELELVRLKDVLIRTLKQRDDAQAQCRKLVMEKLRPHRHLQHQQQDTASPFGVFTEDDSKPALDRSANNLISSSGSEPAMVSSPGSDSVLAPVTIPTRRPPSSLPEHALKLAANRPLPAKGKLLQAVKDAGPLLQNLLLAGPLPQWQHPPPQLASIDIPPVAVASNKLKRGPENYGDSDNSPKFKYQKVVEADFVH